MRRLLAVVLVLSTLSFAQIVTPDAAVKTIRPERIRAHMRFLADGLLQGRETGTPGYDIAAAYVATQLEAMGLKPAGVNGSWFQPVPLRSYKIVSEKSSLEVVRDGKPERLALGKDYVLWWDPVHPESALEAPVAFVGYGISAPELNHDDYSGIDVRGKVVLMLYGAPAGFVPMQRSFYSDRVYKARTAADKGAVGILTVFTPEDAKRIQWERATRNVLAGGMRWLEADGSPHDSVPQLRGQAPVSQHGAELLLTGAPKTLEQVFAESGKGKVEHFALPVSVKMHTVTEQTPVQSANILGLLPGSDPKLRNEYVVYTAHLDHLGKCLPVNGDNVCHGAMDNASGTAMLLEIAHAFATLPRHPRRSILFAFVTGEEKGHLGSDYFVNHPTVAPQAMTANINIDMPTGMLYPLKEISLLGAEDSDLAKYAVQAVRRTSLKIVPDPIPEQGFFMRSDQYSFFRHRVPAVFITPGFKSADLNLNGDEITKKWFASRYHTPADDMNQPIYFESGVKLAQFNFLLGYEVAQQAQRPTWKAGSFFGLKLAAAKK